MVAVFASLTLLGLAFLSDSLNEGILYIPRLLVALALVLIGVVLGAFARAWLERTSAQLDFPVAIGPVVQVLVIVLFGLCAAVQAGVTVAPLTAIAIVLLAACAFTLALAFGLGAREIARSLTSGRYARADFEVGQTIRVGDVRGEIVSIDGGGDDAQGGRRDDPRPQQPARRADGGRRGGGAAEDVTPARPASSGTAWTRLPDTMIDGCSRGCAPTDAPPIASRRSGATCRSPAASPTATGTPESRSRTSSRSPASGS